MTRTPGSSGNTSTWTLSFWVKRCNQIGQTGQKGLFSAGDGGGDTGPGDIRYDLIGFNADKIQFGTFNGVTSTGGCDLYTNALFRDPSSWYHVVVRYDDTQSTAADRVRIYVNGVSQTFTGTSFPAEDKGSSFNAAYLQRIVGTNWVTSRAEDCYLAEIVMIDGSSLAASSFGETNSTTGQWVAKDVSGLTFGTNGFHLKFQDSSAFGDDTSGNGNDFSTSGLAANDQVTDSPTNNFCVWNVIDAGSGTLSNGDLVLAGTTDRSGTFGMDSGKWAWKITTAASGAFGVVQGSLTGTESTYSAGSGEVLEFQLDISAGTLEVSVDGGSYSSVATGLTSGPYLPLAKAACTADFGQSGFTRDDTTFNYLSTAGLDDPTIADPSAYFQTTTYTGNGDVISVDQSGNSTFQPEVVYIKGRSGTTSAEAPQWCDTILGTGWRLQTDGTGAKGETGANGIKSFDSDGFTVGENAAYNEDDALYVAWQWDEGTTPGFDMVAYTGTGVNRTVSHNLGVVPSFFIVKRLDASGSNFGVYHKSVGNTKSLFLQSNGVAYDSDEYFNDTSPTSSVITLGTNAQGNTDTGTYTAWIWAEVDGFSKFGSYTGTADANGPFVYTGFRPAWVMIKQADTSSRDWIIQDAVRNPYNPANLQLLPNASSNEATTFYSQSAEIDIVSNGFKVRSSAVRVSESGAQYVYAAFAHAPFKTANAR